MKQLYTLLFSIIICLDAFGLETVKVATLTFTKDMFRYFEEDNGTLFLGRTNKNPIFTYDRDTIVLSNIYFYDDPMYLPCVIYYQFRIPIQSNEDYVSYTIEKKEELIYQDCILAYPPLIVSGCGDDTLSYEEYNTPPMAYELKDYPDNTITQFIQNQYYSRWDRNYNYGDYLLYKDLIITLSPFRYDALNKKLYLLTDITLNITLEESDATDIQDIEANEGKKKGIIYDISGRKLNNPPTTGIYIKDGKKTVPTNTNK